VTDVADVLINGRQSSPYKNSVGEQASKAKNGTNSCSNFHVTLDTDRCGPCASTNSASYESGSRLDANAVPSAVA